jgi:RNA polymerase sigma factor (sigma-70 family)
MTIHTEAEFTQVYRANYADVLRFVRRRAHPLNVDDIVGETFLAAWRRRDELPADPRPWLFRAARNVMLNSARGANRQTAVAVKIAQASEPTTSGGLGGLDDRVDLMDAWRTMPPADQEVLALHVWEDLSAKDAASVLGCSRAAYAMRLTRAKRQLASLLDVPSTGPITLIATR